MHGSGVADCSGSFLAGMLLAGHFANSVGHDSSVGYYFRGTDFLVGLDYFVLAGSYLPNVYCFVVFPGLGLFLLCIDYPDAGYSAGKGFDSYSWEACSILSYPLPAALDLVAGGR